MEQEMLHGAPTVAYITKCFPRLSETFILHEVVELERQGMTLRIFSLLQASGKMHQAAQAVQAQVTYMPQGFLRTLSLLGAVVRRFIKAPRTTLAVLMMAIWHFHHIALFKHLLAAFAIAEQIEHEGISHVHAHYANVPATIALIVHRLTGIPYSFTAHAKDIYLSQPAHLAYKIARARFVVTCTCYNQEYLTGVATTPLQTPIHRIYHGLNLRAFPAPEIAVHPLANDVPLILTVARLVDKKGLPYLLEACHLLKTRDVAFNCHIIGDGPMRAMLEQRIQELELSDRVTLCGAQTHERVIEEYQQASVKVLPCIVSDNGDRDGIPNVLVEAMYMGVPVISTPISGIPELLNDGVNGVLVAPHDGAALADAIMALLHDAPLRACLASAARQTVLERFSTEQNVLLLKQLFSTGTLPASVADNVEIHQHSYAAQA